MQEKQELDAKSHRQKRQVQQKLKQWHIFVDQVDTVAGGITHLELIIPGTAGAAARVIHLGSGEKHIHIAVASCPVADVHILQIGEMLFVKQTDLLQDGFPVNGRAAAAGKNLFRLRVALHRLSLASGIGPSQCTVVISRIV